MAFYDMHYHLTLNKQQEKLLENIYIEPHTTKVA